MLTPFFVWQDRKLKRIDPAKVMFLSSAKNYTKMFVSGEKKYLLVRSTLSGALQKLPPDMFIKVHRSLAVSVYFIDGVTSSTIIIGETELPIGKHYYDIVIKKLNIID